MSLFICLVRTWVKYCSVLWFPNCTTMINTIEAIQRKFTRLDVKYDQFRGVTTMESYRSRYLLHGLQTLEHRLKERNVCLMLKYKKKRIIRCLLEKSSICVPSRPLRSRNLLVDESWRVLYGYNEPLLAMLRQFNTCFITLILIY